MVTYHTPIVFVFGAPVCLSFRKVLVTPQGQGGMPPILAGLRPSVGLALKASACFGSAGA